MRYASYARKNEKIRILPAFSWKNRMVEPASETYHERINKSGIGVKKIEQKVDKHKLIASYSDLGNGVGSKHRTSLSYPKIPPFCYSYASRVPNYKY